jgi:hypothetical protein
MTFVVRGYEMPEGTVLYFLTYCCVNFRSYGYVKTTRSVKDKPHLAGLQYVYDPNDGLLASRNVRKFWEEYPYSHPHCTLFSLLYKKLEIRSDSNKK